MDVPDLGVTSMLLLAGAAALAGGVNAVAGGGSLISFPALLWLGYPALLANVTNTVALTPGYVGGTVGYRAELRGQGRTAVALSATSVVGALVGSAVLLISSPEVFERIVPWLIVTACLLLAVQRPVRDVVARRTGSGRGSSTIGQRLAVHSATFVSAAYGAYFGAGLGIMLLAVLGILLGDGLQRLNALKGLLSLVINVVGAIYFAAFAEVVWVVVAVMAVAALIGGRVGVALARRLDDRVLRWVVIVFGLAVAVQLVITG